MSPSAETAPYVAGALIGVLGLLLGFLADPVASRFARRYSGSYGGDARQVADLMTTHYQWATDLTGGSLAPLSAVAGVTLTLSDSRDATVELLVAFVVSIGLFVVALLAGPRRYERLRNQARGAPPLGVVAILVNTGLAVALALT